MTIYISDFKNPNLGKHRELLLKLTPTAPPAFGNVETFEEACLPGWLKWKVDHATIKGEVFEITKLGKTVQFDPVKDYTYGVLTNLRLPSLIKRVEGRILLDYGTDYPVSPVAAMVAYLDQRGYHDFENVCARIRDKNQTDIMRFICG
jgi:hypothetical protein